MHTDAETSGAVQISATPEIGSVASMVVDGAEIGLITAELRAATGVTATIPFLLWGDSLRAKALQ